MCCVACTAVDIYLWIFIIAPKNLEIRIPSLKKMGDRKLNDMVLQQSDVPKVAVIWPNNGAYLKSSSGYNFGIMELSGNKYIENP